MDNVLLRNGKKANVRVTVTVPEQPASWHQCTVSEQSMEPNYLKIISDEDHLQT
jgi:hypothetical protein